jgi:integrase
MYVEAYAQRGLSSVDIERLAQNWQQKTRQRYESGWNHFLAVAVHPGRLRASLRDFLHNLQSTPLCQVVAWLAEVCDAASGSVARNAYSALLLLPCCHQLRYEPTMTPLKRRWNKNTPRYDVFYDIEPLLQKMLDAPEPVDIVDVRLRAILLLRLLCMYRGIDLARTYRPIIVKQGVHFMSMLRKGKRKKQLYPLPKIQPDKLNPIYWVEKYMDMTPELGPELFWALPSAEKMKPLVSDTINSLTTRFLKVNGLKDFTAHSTRGACATALLKKGVPPQVVQQMGDWTSEISFNLFYNRLRATQAWQQVLVPDVGVTSCVPHSGATSSASPNACPQLPA